MLKYYATIYIQFKTWKTILAIGYGYIPIHKYGNMHRHDEYPIQESRYLQRKKGARVGEYDWERKQATSMYCIFFP